MRKIIITVLAVCLCKLMYAQLPLKSEGFTKTERGYILFEKGYESYVKFVPVRSESISNDLSNFITKNLGLGYQINYHRIITDSLKPYGKTYKLENGRTDSALLTIVPITLTYSIQSYRLTKQRMKMNTTMNEYKISNVLIKVRNVGGIDLEITSSAPEIYYGISPKEIVN